MQKPFDGRHASKKGVEDTTNYHVLETVET